ncbi:MAG: TrkA C-terminal domain-containing protein [Ornithinibacter sp.]
MTPTFELLAGAPLLLLAVLLALGAALGSVRVGGVHLGPAAVLFAALGLSAWATSTGVELEVSEAVGTFGLVLFTYTVGVVAGPQFFASLRRGWVQMVLTAVALVLVGVATAVGGRLLDLPGPVVAGAYAGSLTNTPALAAASARAGEAAGPTIGYSITYLGGVLVMLAISAWALNRPGAEPRREGVEHLTIRVELEPHLTVGELTARYDHRISVSRVKTEYEANPTTVPPPDQALAAGDLLTVVGSRPLLEEVSALLGHTSSHDIVADRREVDFRRVTLSNTALAGHTIGELELARRYGARVSRVRRGDLDLVVHDTFVLQMGDRLRVIAPGDRMSEVTSHLGDSDRGMSDINVGGLALGLSVGLAVGMVYIPLPGGGFAVGAAAGTLLVGLVFGRVGRIGPVVTSMSHGAAQSLSALGMVTFLAFAGVRAGQHIGAALGSGEGWNILLLGLAMTLLAGVLLILALHTVSGLPWLETAGAVAGAQTQPAVLAFVDERSGHDTRVGVGYALVYPVAMIVKIIVAQVLAGLG